MNRHQRLDAIKRIAEPIPFLPLAERDFPGGHHQHEQSQANGVEVQRLAAQLGSRLLEVVWIFGHKPVEGKGQEADRDIDIKNPTPIEIDDQPAPERRADDRPQERGDTKERLCRALFFGRKAVEQYRLAARLQAPAGQPLQRAEHDDLRQAR